MKRHALSTRIWHWLNLLSLATIGMRAPEGSLTPDAGRAGFGGPVAVLPAWRAASSAPASRSCLLKMLPPPANFFCVNKTPAPASASMNLERSRG